MLTHSLCNAVCVTRSPMLAPHPMTYESAQQVHMAPPPHWGLTQGSAMP